MPPCPKAFTSGAWGRHPVDQDGGGDASMELDPAGMERRGEPGLTLDLGMLKYQYPSNSSVPAPTRWRSMVP